MMARKQSFLERLTGTQSVDDVETRPMQDGARTYARNIESDEGERGEDLEANHEYDSDEGDADEEPGMAIDMYESDNELVLQGMIAGVTPENLHISITRTTVTIKGKRTGPQGIPEDHYVLRELYWGPFSRVIELPYEVDTEGAEAIEKYGLLIIRLPKIDTERTAELKVKSIQ